MGFGNFSGLGDAIGLPPDQPQPVRRVEARGVLLGDKPLAFARQPPQDGVDQALVRRGSIIAGSQFHDGVHGRVGGGIQKQNLGRAKTKQILRDGLQFLRLVEARLDRAVKLAQTAQRRRHQHVHERAVALFQFGQAFVAFQSVVEGLALAHHGLQQVERGGAGRKSG